MRVEEISSVTFHNCVEKGDWIFDVRSVAIEVSEDGKNFERVFFGEYPEMQEPTVTDCTCISRHLPR